MTIWIYLNTQECTQTTHYVQNTQMNTLSCPKQASDCNKFDLSHRILIMSASRQNTEYQIYIVKHSDSVSHLEHIWKLLTICSNPHPSSVLHLYYPTTVIPARADTTWMTQRDPVWSTLFGCSQAGVTWAPWVMLTLWSKRCWKVCSQITMVDWVDCVFTPGKKKKVPEREAVVHWVKQSTEHRRKTTSGSVSHQAQQLLKGMQLSALKKKKISS